MKPIGLGGWSLNTHRPHPEEAHRSRVYPRSAHQLRKSATPVCTMLPSTPARGFRPTSGRSTRWRDAEDHFDAVVIDLNPADDGMDDLTHAEPVEPVQTVTHLGGKILQSADDE